MIFIYILMPSEPDPFLGGTTTLVSAVADSRFSAYNSPIQT
jgi:hypothetical protein